MESEVVAAASVDVLLANQTGHIIDVRRVDPLSAKELTSDIELEPVTADTGMGDS